MRTMQSLAAVITVTGILAGCGSARDSGAERTQPLADWYVEAPGVLVDLGQAYTKLGKNKGESLTSVAARPQVRQIELAARKGLEVRAPEGHPELDKAFDKVMHDSLDVVRDVRTNASGAFVVDSVQTLGDMDTLNRLIDRLAPRVSPAG